MKVSFQNNRVYNLRNHSNFGANNKLVRELLKDIDNLHLDDKFSYVLNNLKQNEYLVVSPSQEKSLPVIGNMLEFLQKSMDAIYHITNEKFGETLIFKKNDLNQPEFMNFTHDKIRMNTVDILPYFGMPMKEGDRIWGSTLRSLLYKGKNVQIPEDLKNHTMLFKDHFEYRQISALADEVLSPVPHFSLHRKRR